MSSILDHDGPLRGACTALETYWQNLCKLRCEGLPLDVALNFHTIFVNGAITHFLRAAYAPEAWCQNWDERALRFWELELQRDFGPDQRLQFFLPFKLAGSGVQAAQHRHAAAFLGSWELCLHDVAQTVCLSSAEAVRARLSELTRLITSAESAVRAFGIDYKFDWEACFANPRPKVQKSLTTAIHKALHTHVSRLLDTDDGQGATFQSSGGKGAGSCLLSPLAGEQATRLNDVDLRTSLRARFRCNHPGHEKNSQPAPSTHCKHIFCSKHRTRAGQFCGAALDLRGNHARGCEVGGVVLKFHNLVRDWLAGTLERWHPGVPVLTEQRVAAWDYQLPPPPNARPGERPPIHEATLDIRIPAPGGRGRLINVDVGFADPYTVDVAELRLRAQKPGRAAAAYVYHKHQTYPAWRNPTEDLVPFILESFGNPSVKAVNFLRHMAPADRGLRSLELRRAYRELSCLTQQRLAHLLRSAEDNARPN